MIGKDQDLWQPHSGVTAQDICHIHFRVDLFRCIGNVCRRPGGIPKCRFCFARWVCQAASNYDTSQALAVPQLDGTTVAGLASLLLASKIPKPLFMNIECDVAALGHVHVRERPAHVPRIAASSFFSPSSSLSSSPSLLPSLSYFSSLFVSPSSLPASPCSSPSSYFLFLACVTVVSCGCPANGFLLSVSLLLVLHAVLRFSYSWCFRPKLSMLQGVYSTVGGIN